jgi:chromosome segregation ATPase
VSAQVSELRASAAKLERERDAANAELVAALAERSNLRARLAARGDAEAEAARLQARVDLAMEMLGERNARVRAAAAPWQRVVTPALRAL